MIWSKRLLGCSLSLAVTVLLFGGMEFYLRLKRAAFEAKYSKHDGAFRESSIPGLIYEMKPNQGEINSFGFRDEEWSKSPPEGVTRICVLGDSLAFAQHTRMEQGMCEVLEKLLNQNDHAHYEVCNLAISGYGTQQELIVLREKALALDPDIVALAYCLNDPAHPLYDGANGKLGVYFHEPWSHTWFFFARRLHRVRRKLGGVLSKRKSEYHRDLHFQNLRKIRKALTRFASICRNHGADPMMVVFPVLPAKKKASGPYPLRDVHNSLRKIAESLEIDHLDMLKPFSEAGLKSLMVAPDDPWHFNAQGHRRAAKAMAGSIKP